jgi:hypothetical protein
MVAPIALYPDGLLTHVFMASTYPLQVVQASRFMEKNPGLKGDELDAKLKEQDWDPAVKSMCTFPDVLKKMSDNLDWMQDLGDATLGQQTELLDAVQRMRGKAYDTGKLESNDKVNIKVEQQPPPEPKIIVIESKDPEVIYVPTYSPTVVYGGWGYPYWYYPGMYPYYPPGYGFWSFTAGVIVGGAIWGSCGWGWGHSDIDIDIDSNRNFNNRTEVNPLGDRGDRGGDRAQARDRGQGTGDRARASDRGQGTGDRAGASDRAAGGAGDRGQGGAGDRGQGGKQSWQHNPQNRKGVNYRDNATAKKFGGTGASSRVSSADARGRSGGTRQAGSTGGMRQAQAMQRQGGAGSVGGGAGAGARDRAGAGAGSARSGSSRAGAGNRSGGGAYSGSRNPGMDRSSSSRGSSSRGGGGYSGGSRGGGGGGFSRGGGGGGRGGGGGGRRR